MKRKSTFYLAVSLLILSITNTKCNNNSSSFKPSKSDTIQQLMAYVDKDSNRVSQIAARIAIDTGYIIKGSNSVSWKRDSFYFAKGLFPMYDSSGRQKYDSQNKPYMQWLWYPLKRSDVVRDGDFTKFNLDSFWNSSPKKIDPAVTAK